MEYKDKLKVLNYRRARLKDNIKLLDYLIEEFKDSSMVQNNLGHIKEDRSKVLKSLESDIKALKKSMRNDVK